MYNVFLSRMNSYLKYLLLILPILWVFNSSCVKNETCVSSNNKLRIDLYKAETDSTFSVATLDSLTLYFIGNEDSLVYNNEYGISSIEIPLSDTTENLSIVLQINDGVDFMELDYKPYFVFRSTECGVINRYEIEDVRCTGNKVSLLYLENIDIDESEAVNLFMVVDID